MKKLFISLITSILCLQLPAQDKNLIIAPDRPVPEPEIVSEPVTPDKSLIFAEYDTQKLSMDIYMPDDNLNEHYCIVFAYGGGFKDNNQKSSTTASFCRKLADDGYVAVAIDYRLGLKDVKMKGIASMVKPLENAVTMAAEDMLKATGFILEHAKELKIKPDGIVLCGSSAGAMTALQTDYLLCNGSPLASFLPDDFHFAGVMSFSGAVFSKEGKCDYKLHSPAPTMMLHGTADKIVTYNKISFFNTRLSGSSDLVKRFKKNGYTYEIIRYVNEGHGVANRMSDSYYEVTWFLENIVRTGRHYEIDKTILDSDHKAPSWDKNDAKTLY